MAFDLWFLIKRREISIYSKNQKQLKIPILRMNCLVLSLKLPTIVLNTPSLAYKYFYFFCMAFYLWFLNKHFIGGFQSRLKKSRAIKDAHPRMIPPNALSEISQRNYSRIPLFIINIMRRRGIAICHQRNYVIKKYFRHLYFDWKITFFFMEWNNMKIFRLTAKSWSRLLPYNP